MAGDSRTPPTTVIAWQGIELRVSASWAPARMTGDLRAGTLTLTDGRLQRMHLDWTHVRRPGDLRRRLSRFLSSFARKGAKEKGALLPEDTSFPLPPDKTAAFASWDTGAGRAFAGVVYCRTCRRLTTLRMALKRDESARALFARMTRAFRDHADGDRRLWAFYCFHAATPADAVLASSRIEGGRIELVFNCRRDTVSITQLGLARTILERRSLREWFLDVHAPGRRGQGLDVSECPFSGHDGLQWSQRRRAPFAAESLGRAWRCEPSNRIYMVHLRSPGPDEDRLDAWCRDILCHAPSPAGEIDPGFLECAPSVRPRPIARLDSDESGLARIILNAPTGATRPRVLALDALGTEVLRRCDGRTSLAAITQTFAREHRLHPREAEVSVLPFLRTLTEKGAIELIPEA